MLYSFGKISLDTIIVFLLILKKLQHTRKYLENSLTDFYEIRMIP